MVQTAAKPPPELEMKPWAFKSERGKLEPFDGGFVVLRCLT